MKKTYKNKYNGRGYVQLTWGYNYQRLDEKIGNGSYPTIKRKQNLLILIQALKSAMP